MNQEVKQSQVAQLMIENKNLKERCEYLDKGWGEEKKISRSNICSELHNALVKKLTEQNEKLKEELDELKAELEVDENGCSRGYNKGYEQAEADNS